MAAVTHIYAGAAHWRAKGRFAGVFRAEPTKDAGST